MSTIISPPQTTAPIITPAMAPCICSLPGSYQKIEEAAPAKAAAYTRNFVIRKA